MIALADIIIIKTASVVHDNITSSLGEVGAVTGGEDFNFNAHFDKVN